MDNWLDRNIFEVETITHADTDAGEMEALFRAREEEIGRLKRDIARELRESGADKDVFLILKREMVELIERDINLWHQLTALNDAVADLKRELIETRARNNTFSNPSESELAFFKDEVDEGIQTKPRSHTVTSAENILALRSEALVSLESQRFRNIKEVHINTEMADIQGSLHLSNNKNGFFGIFNTFHLKSGLFESSMTRFRNNVFLSGLNSGFVDLVGDLMKPSSEKHILPRRKLHRQSNVFELDELDRDIETKVNTSSEGLQSILPNNVNEKRDFTPNNATDAGLSTDTLITHSYDACSDDDADDIEDITLTEEAGVENNVDNDTDSSGLTEGPEEAELSDISFRYLVLQDGYVSCRIMTPDLEQQIQIKRETEDEPLEYLRCSSGFARFRSGSDSDSLYSSESDYLYSESGDSADLSDDDSDYGFELRKLFDMDLLDEEIISDNESRVSRENGDCELLVQNNAKNRILQEFKSDSVIDDEYISKTVESKLLTACFDTNGNANDVPGEPKSSLVSDEYVGNAVGVHAEKQGNFQYRISSVDSGIGDEMSDSLDIPD